MSAKKVITTDSFIRDLPFSVIRGLCAILDPDAEWKDLVGKIPKQLDSDDKTPRYSQLQVRVFGQRGLKTNGSATTTVLEDWGTQNARLRHLIQALNDAKLYSSVTYINKTLSLKDNCSISNASRLETHNSESDDKNEQIIYERETKIQNQNGLRSLEPSVHSSDIMSSGDCVNVSFNSGGDISVGAGAIGCSSPRVPGEHEEESDPVSAVLLKKAPYNLLEKITNNFDDLPVHRGGRLVGSGGFGHVFLGRFSNGFKVAVKRLILNEDLNMEKQFLTELKTLSTYRHDNVVSILGYSRESGHKCLVYEFMENGSLEDRLTCKDGTEPLTAIMRIRIAEGTARGINYLHSMGLIHRDIKSANVLLDTDFVPKVGDFATVRAGPRGSQTAPQSTSVVIGTPAYLAPEAMRFDVSSKLDSFAFGVVLLELLTGLKPMDESREDKDLVTFVESSLEDGDILLLVDEKAGPWNEEHVHGLYDMAMQCLVFKKKSRALIEDILPIFEKLDLNSV